MKQRVIGQIIIMFSASLGFVAALAWNDAVHSVFENIKFFQDNQIFTRFIYAIIVTIIAIFLSTILSQFLDDDQKKEISNIHDKGNHFL